MNGFLTVAKFLLGAAVLLFALLDVDAQPAIVVLALLLMGVLTYDQIRDWFGRKNPPNEGQTDAT